MSEYTNLTAFTSRIYYKFCFYLDILLMFMRFMWPFFVSAKTTHRCRKAELYTRGVIWLKYLPRIKPKSSTSM